MSDFDLDDRSEYPLGPEPGPNPRSRVRIRTSLLGYDAAGLGRPIPYARRASQQEAEPGVSPGTQFILGFISPIAYPFLISMAFAALAPLKMSSAATACLTWVSLGGYVALVAFMTVKMRWKGFLAGVLTMVFVIPLALIVICGVVGFGIAGMAALAR